ncbi:MAG: hypothetical protein AAF805_04445, partial [Planctomycetota bacterium]
MAIATAFEGPVALRATGPSAFLPPANVSRPASLRTQPDAAAGLRATRPIGTADSHSYTRRAVGGSCARVGERLSPLFRVAFASAHPERNPSGGDFSMADAAKLSIGDKEIELPTVVGSEGEVGL